MNLFEDVDLSSLVVRVAEVTIVLAVTVLVNAGVKIGLRVLTRRQVRRALAGQGRWRLRLPRSNDGTDAELRRVQRADAAAHMLSRISTLIIAVIALLAISKLVGIDPVVLVSSAGFIGAGIAIGGQALIKDWLIGLLVLLEDRYAVGDAIEVQVGGEPVRGTVETMSGFGLRLRLPDGSTWHTGHGTIEAVTNLSQQLIPQTLEIPSDVWAELDETMIGPELNAASHDLGLTGILIAEEIAAEEDAAGNATITFQASRQLNDRQRKVIARRILGEEFDD